MYSTMCQICDREQDHLPSAKMCLNGARRTSGEVSCSCLNRHTGALWKVTVPPMLLQGSSRSQFGASIVFNCVKARTFQQRQHSLIWLSANIRAPRAVMIPAQIQH